MDSGKGFAGKQEWLSHPNVLPGAVARLVQSLIEEAEAGPETLTEALSLVTYFARGCNSSLDWKALCRGPYAGELLHQAWLLYKNLDTPKDAWVRNSYACFAAYRRPTIHWLSEEGQDEIFDLLNDTDSERVCLGLMTAVGVLWNSSIRRPKNSGVISSQIAHKLESLLFDDNPAVAHVALWTWSLNLHYVEAMDDVSEHLLNFFLANYFKQDFEDRSNLFSFTLYSCMGLRRDSWKAVLTTEQIAHIQTIPLPKAGDPNDKNISAALVIAFHAGSVWDDAELVTKIAEYREFAIQVGGRRECVRLDKMLSQIEPFGVQHLKVLEEQEAKDELIDTDIDFVDEEEFEDLSESSEV
ncbi:hypothetical protein D3C75_565540 [compost metagenome]